MIAKYLGHQKSIKYSLGIFVAIFSARYIYQSIKLYKIREELNENAKNATELRIKKLNRFYSIYRQDVDNVGLKFFQQPNQECKETFKKLYERDIKVIKKLIYEKKITIPEILIIHICMFNLLGQQNPNSKTYLADICYEEAINEAHQQQKKINQYPELIWQNGNELMGIPIIVQDNFTTFWMLQTYGCQSFALNISNSNSDIIRAIKQAGGIIFAKANVPQTSLSPYQSLMNNVWGDSHHYGADFFSSGYQSGAVASLTTNIMAAGIGSDIDGSLRISAQFNNIFSFKPTSTRVGRENMELQYQGNHWIRPSHGFLQTSVNSLIEMTKAVFNHQVQEQQSYFDPFCSRIQFDDKKFNQNIKYGYFKQFSKVPIAQSLLNVIDETVQKLRQFQGIECKEFQFDENLLQELKDCYFNIIFSNTSEVRSLLLNGEQDMFENKPLFVNVFVGLINLIFSLLGENFINTLPIQRNRKKLSSTQVFENISKLIEIRNQFCQELVRQEINVLLLPLGIFPLAENGLESLLFYNDVPSIMVNALDLPCGSIVIDKRNIELIPDLKQDFLYIQMKMQRWAFDRYDSQIFPISVSHGIQIVSLPNNDEICLQAMKQIEQLRSFTKQ